MNGQAIRDAIKAVPFRPFRMRLADGRELAVEHPDYILIAPNNREVVVYSKEGRMSIVEPLLIVSLERVPPEQATEVPDSDVSNGNGQDAPA